MDMFVSRPHLKGLSWQTLTQTDPSKEGPEPSAAPQQSDKWWEDVEPAGLGVRTAGLGMELADG